jgi:hypothetical protein
MKLYYLLPILLLFAFVVTSPAHVPGAEQNKGQSTHAKNNPDSQQQGTNERPFVVKAIGSPPTKEQTEYEKYQAHTKPWYDLWTLVITGWLALVTSVLAALTYYLWRSTKTTAKAALKTAEYIPAIERARLFVELQESPNTAEQPNQLTVAVDIQIINEGKTPAILTDILVGMRPLTANPKGIDSYSIPTWPYSGKKYILAGQSEPVVKTAIVNNITQELNLFRRGQVMIFCYGLIRYEDVLGDKWERGFCWQYNQLGNFRMSAEGNYEKKYT